MTDCYHAEIVVDDQGDLVLCYLRIPELGDNFRVVEYVEELDAYAAELIRHSTDQEGPFRVLYEFV